MNHLVLLRQPYLDLILAGTKTVESRLSRRRHPAATRCAVGDTLYLKDVGGDVRGRARVAEVTEYRDLPPGGVERLAAEWAGRVVGGGSDDPYWLAKATARFALFIELVDVEAFSLPHRWLPPALPWASGWIVGQPSEALVVRAQAGSVGA